MEHHSPNGSLLAFLKIWTRLNGLPGVNKLNCLDARNVEKRFYLVVTEVLKNSFIRHWWARVFFSCQVFAAQFLFVIPDLTQLMFHFEWGCILPPLTATIRRLVQDLNFLVCLWRRKKAIFTLKNFSMLWHNFFRHKWLTSLSLATVIRRVH